MSGLTFTEDAARHLARVYLTPDVVAQRAETMKQLALSPGERVLDIGCGPGFLCESIAAAVGGDGAVTGIDISGDLIALCRSRNPPQMAFIRGWRRNEDCPARRFARCRCLHPGRRIRSRRRSRSCRDVPRAQAGRPGCIRGNGLGCRGLAFRKAGADGFGHEVLGVALRASPFAPVACEPVCPRGFSGGRRYRVPDPQSAMAR